MAAFGVSRFLAGLLIPDPAVKRARGNDGDQFLDRTTQRLPELNQPFPLFGLGVDFVTQSSAKDLILFLQILDVFRQLAICPRSNQSEQGMKNLRHGGIVRTSYSGANCTFVVPRLDGDFRR